MSSALAAIAVAGRQGEEARCCRRLVPAAVSRDPRTQVFAVQPIAFAPAVWVISPFATARTMLSRPGSAASLAAFAPPVVLLREPRGRPPGCFAGGAGVTVSATSGLFGALAAGAAPFCSSFEQQRAERGLWDRINEDLQGLTHRILRDMDDA
jgi:hypothetical protein